MYWKRSCVDRVCIMLLLLLSSTGRTQPAYLYIKNFRTTPGKDVSVAARGLDSLGLLPFTNSLVQLVYYSPTERTYDLQSADSSRVQQDFVTLPGLLEGTHMLIMHSKKSYVKVSADSFNRLLDAEKFNAVSKDRRARKQGDSSVRLSTQYCLKTVFQAGKNTGHNSLQATTLPLEIVPRKNLYEYANRNTVKVKFTVLFRGSPLAGTSLKMYHWDTNGRQTVLRAEANRKGVFSFKIPGKGVCVISGYQLSQSMNDPQADWQLYAGSMSWSY